MAFPDTKATDFSLEIPETPPVVFSDPQQQYILELIWRALEILRLQVGKVNENIVTVTTEGIPIFIQDAAPETDAPKYVWIQTNAVGTQSKIWVEDGA